MAKSNKKTKDDIQKQCLACGSVKKSTGFYQSTNPLHADKLIPYCKNCIETLSKNENGEIDIAKFKNVLMQIDKPFLQDVLDSAIDECMRTNSKKYVGLYMKNLALNFKYLTYKDSDIFEDKDSKQENKNEKTSEENEEIIFTDIEEKNKNDVLRMLGYDPFATESEIDKAYLYNRLVDFLDESTLEDSFKLPAVIEIVKSFNQIDKINTALSLITRDVSSIAGNVGGVKSLFDAKEKILKSVLALAKDNGISVNHSNNKSKGAGTLSGIIKQLQEKGFEEAEVNLFDVETAKGMQQVADISNRSIINQLQFDENEYTEMIIEQKEMIQQLDAKVVKLEEENRLLKKELLSCKDGDIDE